jgi:hypothetical protein
MPPLFQLRWTWRAAPQQSTSCGRRRAHNRVDATRIRAHRYFARNVIVSILARGQRASPWGWSVVEGYQKNGGAERVGRGSRPCSYQPSKPSRGRPVQGRTTPWRRCSSASARRRWSICVPSRADAELPRLQQGTRVDAVLTGGSPPGNATMPADGNGTS